MAREGNFAFLGPLEVLAERPFTAPEETERDVIYLGYMVRELRHQLTRPESLPLLGREPLTLHLFEESRDCFAPDGVYNSRGRQYRIAFIRIDPLKVDRNLIVVGFCGRKRQGADRTVVNAVDEELVAEFPQHPYFLSYSSLELANGDWCNLVLFSHWDGLEHWNSSARHWQAVREIAPNYYETIRLHNAILPGGLFSGQKLKMVRTKYYDFGSDLLWLAVREYQPK
jgi:hypothetical protein